MPNYDLTGNVKEVFDTQTFASGFTKREFVVTTTDDDYPQDIKLECVREWCALLDAVGAGDRVRVQFRLRGNAYKDRYYVNLQACQLEKLDASGGSVTVEPDEAFPEDADMDVTMMPF